MKKLINDNGYKLNYLKVFLEKAKNDGSIENCRICNKSVYRIEGLYALDDKMSFEHIKAILDGTLEGSFSRFGILHFSCKDKENRTLERSGRMGDPIGYMVLPFLFLIGFITVCLKS